MSKLIIDGVDNDIILAVSKHLLERMKIIQGSIKSIELDIDECERAGGLDSQIEFYNKAKDEAFDDFKKLACFNDCLIKWLKDDGGSE